jgi:hypothetical protein
VSLFTPLEYYEILYIDKHGSARIFAAAIRRGRLEIPRDPFFQYHPCFSVRIRVVKFESHYNKAILKFFGPFA